MKCILKPITISFFIGTILLANTAMALHSTGAKALSIAHITDSIKINNAENGYPENLISKANSFSLILQPIKNSERIRMIIEKEKGKKLNVQLVSPNGNSILSFTTDKKSESVLRKFNFSEAEEGVYTLEVSDGAETINKKIILQRARVEIKTTLAVE